MLPHAAVLHDLLRWTLTEVWHAATVLLPRHDDIGRSKQKYCNIAVHAAASRVWRSPWCPCILALLLRGSWSRQ
jgi:hypothetical protein